MLAVHRVPHQTTVLLPGHRVSISSLSHVPKPEGSTIKPVICQATRFNHQTSVMFPGNRVPVSNQCHVSRSRESTIWRQSSSQCTGFHPQTSVMLPGHRCLRSNQSLVARPQGYQNQTYSYTQATGYHHQPQSCSQATGVLNQTSVLLPGHSVPPSSLSHIPRKHVSRIKPHQCS